MLKFHTVYVISLISQSTSALVLGLLAWADRRSRWLVPLALACAIHSGGLYLLPLWRGTGHWVPQAFSAASLVFLLYLVHLGFQELIFPLHPRSVRVATGIAGIMLLLAGLARYSSYLCIQVTTTSGFVLLAGTAYLLWTAPSRDLRGPLRATALLLGTIGVLFLARMPFEAFAPASQGLLLMREITILLFTLMAFSFLAVYAAESRRRLHVESRIDLVTGLPNRRDMEEAAAQQLKHALRYNQPCALLMIDLDHFKKLNDTWGHDVGDRALLAVGGLLLRHTRDIKKSNAARMGGEEFAMLLPGCSVHAACTRAERLCAELAALRISLGQTEIGFTASIGVSALHPGETTWTEMLRRADVALYRAKREGRNRVTLCSEAVPYLPGDQRRAHRPGPPSAPSAHPATNSRPNQDVALASDTPSL